MNRVRQTRGFAILLLAAAGFLVWKSGRREEPPPDSPARAEVHAAPTAHEAVVSVWVEDRSTSALAALVEERLRAWEERDEPELRPQRTRELEELLCGRADKLEVAAALPAALANFAFGLPTFQAWMVAEPRAAADWMSEHPVIAEARLLTLLENWKAKNSGEVRAYLAALPPGLWREKALAAASNLAVASDPVEAIQWARQMNPDARQTGLLELATLGWARRDPTAAAQWVQRVTDQNVRPHLAGALAVAYAEIDPALAAEWAIRTVPPGNALDRSVAEIAGAWAKYEPVAVAAWVTGFPAGPARDLAVGNLLNAWGLRDHAAAAAWVRALADDQFRAEAFNLLAALPK